MEKELEIKEDNIHDLSKMGNKELLRYYEGLKSTTQHLKELVQKNSLPKTSVDWFNAFEMRNEVLDKVQAEILKRMGNVDDVDMGD